MNYKSVDLDNFPTSPTAKRMLSRVSSIYDRSYVAKWLFQVMGIELDEMKEIIKALPLQSFPEVATWGIKYLEQKYDLEVDENRPLQERRETVIASRPYRGPISPYRLEKLIENICGVETYIYENIEKYIFTISVNSTGNSINAGSIKDGVDKNKPSHLGYELNIEKRFNELIAVAHVIQRMRANWTLDVNRAHKQIVGVEKRKMGAVIVHPKTETILNVNRECENTELKTMNAIKTVVYAKRSTSILYPYQSVDKGYSVS